MRKKYVILCATFLLTLLLPTVGTAQSWEEMVNEMQNEFDEFQTSVEKSFNDFVEANDKAFSDLLRQSWTEFDAMEGIKRPEEAPKPDDVPIIDPLKIDKTVDEIKIEVDEPDEKNNIEVYKPKAPPIRKTDETDYSKLVVDFAFYGTDIHLLYDKEMKQTIAAADQNAIADYWDKMASTNYVSLLNQCEELKVRYNLNDYAYYMLIRDMAQKVHTDKNSATMLTWFMLIKSEYKAKLGYNDNGIFLLMPSNSKMYSRKYYEFDNKKYYLMGDAGGSIYSYKEDYPTANKLFDLNVNKPIGLSYKQKIRKVSFKDSGKEYNFDIKYNENTINFYDDYPQGDIKIFFDAAVSPATKISLVEGLKPVIKDMNELDASNFLLRFVQTGFEYKTDDQQFKREKFFFPEEVFFYPYCDCEDRSVLFAYLVKELIGLDVVGLSYPGHMATAVKFNGDYGMDFFNYKDSKYVVADPTYINAPVGMCMPQFRNTSAKIIELANTQSRKSTEEKIWDKVMSAGGYPGGNGTDVVFDSSDNAYMTGYFAGTLTLDGKTVTSVNDKSDVFVAKLDNNQRVVWLKSAGSAGSDQANVIAADKAGNIYISGTYTKEMSFDTKKLSANGVKDVFVAKYSPDGKLIWANRADIAKPDLAQDHIYVSRFDSDGTHKSTIIWSETGSFTDYGIAFDDENSCFVTVSFSAADQGAISENYDLYSGFDFVESWLAANEELLNDDYVSPIAGLFAFIKTVRVSGVSVTGDEIVQALSKNNMAISRNAPGCFANIKNIGTIKNNSGIISITTKGGNPIEFDQITIEDNARLKVTTYTGGNAQVNVMSGVKFGTDFVKFTINNVRLDKSSGNLIFDYDADHTKTELNLKNDIMR